MFKLRYVVVGVVILVFMVILVMVEKVLCI